MDQKIKNQNFVLSCLMEKLLDPGFVKIEVVKLIPSVVRDKYKIFDYISST